MPEENEGPDKFEDPPSFFPYGEGNSRPSGALGDLIEVQIEGVFAAESNGSISRFVLLSDGERKLPILIGPYEASAISLPLEGTRPDRPMTHDLIKVFIDRLNCTLDRMVIDDLWNTTYYAKLYIRTDKEEMEIDARPSDAIAISVRFGAPIYVADAILEQGMEE